VAAARTVHVPGLGELAQDGGVSCGALQRGDAVDRDTR
jgi:hypothetical protein